MRNTTKYQDYGTREGKEDGMLKKSGVKSHGK
jgi:hypothetical protein